MFHPQQPFMMQPQPVQFNNNTLPQFRQAEPFIVLHPPQVAPQGSSQPRPPLPPLRQICHYHKRNHQNPIHHQHIPNPIRHNAHMPQLSLPPAKRQRKKDIVPPIEKLTQDPIVRAPYNEEEKKEIEMWKAERRLHWPSALNMKRKEEERAVRQARGEIELDSNSTRDRLCEILMKQHAMGLSKKAGTEDLCQAVLGGSRGSFRRGRMRGGRGYSRSDYFRQQHGMAATLEKKMHPGKAQHGSDNLKNKHIIGCAGHREKKDPSLLEKLLTFEIRQDRSYLLQSFRFFITNSFLLEYGEKPLHFPPSALQGTDADKGDDGVDALKRSILGEFRIYKCLSSCITLHSLNQYNYFLFYKL